MSLLLDGVAAKGCGAAAMARRALRGLGAAPLLLSVLLLDSGSTSASQARTLSLTYDFAAPEIEAVAGYARVTVAGCETLHRVSKPLLPFRTARVLLPPGYRIERCETELLHHTTLLDGNWLVDYGRSPVQGPKPEGAAKASAVHDQPDPAVYNSSALYPAGRVELVSVQRMAGCDIAVVRLFPIQYRPAEGQLHFSDRLTVTLSLSPAAGNVDAPLVPRAHQSAWDRVPGLVDNPHVLTEYETKRTDAAGPLTAVSFATTFDYLLITTSDLMSAFQPLINRKLQDGLLVKTETVESITNGYSGRDVPEKIRNYIRYAYTNWGVKYVLLGGDNDTVPCRHAYAYVDSQTSTAIPCDLYYACLDGRWNSNTNNQWGEPTDGEGGGDVDLLAEVYVGRAPVDTVAEVGTFVEKSLRYETQGPGDAPSALFVSEFLGSSPSGPTQGGDMLDPLLPYCAAYQVNWLDDRPFTTPQWSKADAINALNRSPQFAIFNGHGTSDILIGDYAPTRSIEAIDLDSLTNQRPFLAYSVGCDVGQFDNFRFFPDCIGEQLVKGSVYGAFAAIFNSRVGFYDPQQEWKFSGEFQVKFFDQLLTRGRTNLGLANQFSKHDMVGHIETTGAMPYRYCYYEITLLGDPHTVVKVSPYPLRIDIDYVTDGAASACILRWPSLPNRFYSVFATTNLTSGDFALLTNGLPATPPLNTFTNRLGDLQMRFYRVEVRDVP